MKSKRGQFYFVAVILLIGMFIGVLLLQNEYRKERNISLEDLEKEISIEKSKLLDHIAYNDLNTNEINSLFLQFSNDYSVKVGDQKSIIFLFGDSAELKIIGNIKEEGMFSYDDGSNITVLSSGDISITKNSLSKISILINEYEYPFTFSDTQNIYYIIRHDYNNEVHIISG